MKQEERYSTNSYLKKSIQPYSKKKLIDEEDFDFGFTRDLDSTALTDVRVALLDVAKKNEKGKILYEKAKEIQSDFIKKFPNTPEDVMKSIRFLLSTPNLSAVCTDKNNLSNVTSVKVSLRTNEEGLKLTCDVDEISIIPNKLILLGWDIYPE